MSHALRHPGFGYSFASHAASHGVAYQSGRTDLLDLEARGLLASHKVGKRYIFVAFDDLEQRLRQLT